MERFRKKANFGMCFATRPVGVACGGSLGGSEKEHEAEKVRNKLQLSAKLVSMRRILPFLFLMAPLQISCADMLGLRGLDFDGTNGGDDALESGAEPVGAGTASEDEMVGISDLNKSEDPPFSLFPMTLPEGAIVVASPRDEELAQFWVYAPNEQELYTYRIGQELMGVQSWPSDFSWSHLLAFPRGEETMLIGYNQEKGRIQWITGADGEGELTDVVAERTVSGGRTHLFAADFDSRWFTVSYSETEPAGGYRFALADPSIAPLGDGGAWGEGWSHLVPYKLDGNDGVIKYRAEDGQLVFERFLSQENSVEGAVSVEEVVSLEEAGTLEIEPGANLVESYQEAGEMSLVFYFAETAEVWTGVLRTSASGDVNFVRRASALWRTHLASITPINIGGIAHAITVAGREADLSSLHDAASVPIVR